MDKLLTVSIAAYNVEKYIKQTLMHILENRYIYLIAYCLRLRS